MFPCISFASVGRSRNYCVLLGKPSRSPYDTHFLVTREIVYSVHFMECSSRPLHLKRCSRLARSQLQKGGVPAAPSGTATLLRLSPSYQFYPRPLLAVTDFRYPRKARERIHRAMADARLLANPASRSRVADSDPN